MAENILASNRLALLFDDGSMGLGNAETTEDDFREEALQSDRGENDPSTFTKIVRVDVILREIVCVPANEHSLKKITTTQALAASLSDEDLRAELARRNEPAKKPRPAA